MDSELEALVHSLANYRAADQAARQARKLLEDALKATPNYQKMVAKQEEAQDAIQRVTAQIIELGRKLYAQTGEKHLLPNSTVEIKIYTEVEILDENAARQWCLTNFTPALVLDGPVFKRAAKENTIPSDLVRVSDSVKVFIASDLTSYLTFADPQLGEAPK